MSDRAGERDLLVEEPTNDPPLEVEAVRYTQTPQGIPIRRSRVNGKHQISYLRGPGRWAVHRVFSRVEDADSEWEHLGSTGFGWGDR